MTDSKYNIWVEKNDGTRFNHPSDKIYPNQLNAWVEGMIESIPCAEILTTVWKHDKGEVRKKFYSPACWTIDLLAIEMFENLCKNHDWYYAYSDDHRVWKAGCAAEDRIKRRYQSLISNSEIAESIKAIYENYRPKGT